MSATKIKKQIARIDSALKKTTPKPLRAINVII
jgi:hypothetical protein